MNKALFILSGEEQENLQRAIETSLRVRRRHHFFLWAQGPLQAFIPHHILICALTREGKEVLVMAPGVKGPLALRERFAHPLEGFDFGSAAGHGSAPVDGCGIIGIFFLFAQMPSTLSPRHAYFIDLLMPNIHMAFLRTLGKSERVAYESADSMRFDALGKTMTGRELEILAWVQQGKSNHEIGTSLEISPLTVKNHMQKILRKLKVSNRAQAVSKAQPCLIDGYTDAGVV